MKFTIPAILILLILSASGLEKGDIKKWSKVTSSEMNWMDANKYCKNLVEGGNQDWRLPTISEIRTLIQNCPESENGGICEITNNCISYKNCSGNCLGCYGKDDGIYSIFGDNKRLWSATEPLEDSQNAFGIGFYDASFFVLPKSDNINVRCVRGKINNLKFKPDNSKNIVDGINSEINNLVSEDFSAFEIVQIFKENIFEIYYEDLKEHDTALKQKTFKKTNQYQKYLEDVKRKKEKIKKLRISIELPGTGFSDYNLKKRGFEYELESKYISGFCLDSVGIKEKKALVSGPLTFYSYYLFIKTNEKQALNIENNKNDLKLKFTFNVRNLVKEDFFEPEEISGGKVYYSTRTEWFPFAYNIDFVIYNNVTQEIYYSIHFK